MKPPPPMLPADGYVTARANPVATAASMALPPRLRMSAPTCEARAERDATMPVLPRISGGLAPTAVRTANVDAMQRTAMRLIGVSGGPV